MGSRRRLAQSRLSDESTATERLIEYTAGHSFGYELTEFTNILRRLIHGVRGEWTFTPDASGTVVRWTYEFKPLRGRYFLVRGGLAPLWRRYMQTGVEAAARVAEERHAVEAGVDRRAPVNPRGS
jgi:hypothetical protein